MASAQHGGPPSALLTYVVEQHLEPGERLNRIHVDLLAGVPLSPLRFQSTRLPVSRRVAHVDARLLSDDRVVAQARGLLVRTSSAPDPDCAAVYVDLPAPEEVATVDAPRWWTPADSTPFHSHAVAHRFVSGQFEEAGPAVDWIDLTVAVVEGQIPSGAQRVAAVSDLGSGISATFDREARFGMINTDLNIAFAETPKGRWFCLDAETTVTSDGTGLALTQIYDQERRLVAVAGQSLLGQYLK